MSESTQDKDRQETQKILEPTNAQRAKALPWVLAGVMATAAFVNLGSGGPIFMLFLDKLGLDKSQIGIIMAIVPFLAVLTLLASGLAAKVGFKRIFIYGWAARVIVLGLLAFAPFIAEKYGNSTAFTFVVLVFAGFALCRMVAVAGMEPWMQVAIPPNQRGRFSAVSNMGGSFISAVTVAVAGFFLGSDPSLNRFSMIYVMALVVGLIGVYFYTRVPPSGSGAKAREKVDLGAMMRVMKDRRFMIFMIGGGLFIICNTILNPGGFLALYLKDSMHFNAGQVTRVGSIYIGVGVFTSIFWGWAADRYGSKPIMMISLFFLGAYGLVLMLIPSGWSHAFIGVIIATVIIGLVIPAWIISYSRYLVIHLIPSDKRGSYSALQLSITGLFGGIAPIIIGWVLEKTVHLSGRIWFFDIVPYTPLFILSLIITGITLVIFGRMPNDARVTTAEFAGMLIEGNPIAAMQAMFSFSRGGEEEKRLLAIQRLARAKSPLAIDELLEAFNDPSSYVRTQAVIAAASSKPHRQLIEALIEMVKLERLETSVAAAWTLGRLGDKSAIEPMRKALDSRFPLLRTRAAVTLSRLGDQDSAPRILELFEQEENGRAAYGDALGVLRYKPAIIPLLDQIGMTEDELARESMAFSIATIIGNENEFLLMLRRIHKDLEDAREELHEKLRTILPKQVENPEQVVSLIDEVLIHVKENDNPEVVRKLSEVVALIPRDRLSSEAWEVIDRSLQKLGNAGTSYPVYARLVIFALLSQLKRHSRFHI